MYLHPLRIYTQKVPRLYTSASEGCIGSEEAGKLSLSHRGSAWSQN